MFSVPAGEYLFGVGIALAGVGTWFVGLGVAYLLYLRWRGDGPRADGTDDPDSTEDDEPRSEE